MARRRVFCGLERKTVAKVSEMVPKEYIEEKKEQVHHLMERLPSFKHKTTQDEDEDSETSTTPTKSMKDLLRRQKVKATDADNPESSQNNAEAPRRSVKDFLKRGKSSKEETASTGHETEEDSNSEQSN